jgi:hypothetical protein
MLDSKYLLITPFEIRANMKIVNILLMGFALSNMSALIYEVSRAGNLPIFSRLVPVGASSIFDRFCIRFGAVYIPVYKIFPAYI